MLQFGSQCVYSCFCDIALHEIKHMFPLCSSAPPMRTSAHTLGTRSSHTRSSVSGQFWDKAAHIMPYMRHLHLTFSATVYGFEVWILLNNPPHWPFSHRKDNSAPQAFSLRPYRSHGPIDPCPHVPQIVP